MDARTAQALIRFGLGRRGEESVPADPAAWLGEQLRQPDPAGIDPLPSTATGLEALRFDRQVKPPPGQGVVRPLFQAQARAELENALTTPAPFRERLVWFWTNHFTVSARGGAAAVAGAFVEEAIRPHVTGRFETMLLAVMHHPAMLIYLNNAQSVGPDSPAGRRLHRGLNENLARECMELHTVSPAAGYTQADVTSFARILTGWSIDLRSDPPGFRFRPFAHEPGAQVVMGHRFPPGEAGGVAALRFLANHPATHRFLATKLVRHFVADTPPPDAVRHIEGALRDTGGDLGAAAGSLITLEAAWQPATKLRTPQDYVIACLRMLDLAPEQRAGMNLPGIVGSLGQPFWNAPQPNGWSDRASTWAAPEAMMRRIDWAYGVSGRVAAPQSGRDAAALAEANLGPLLSADTLQAVRRAGSRRDAMTLLLAAPEFQRR
ncbi:MAG TPA: DUF1800 domain-containing protein [Acetobacteraceae bacterium]|nr:DUF1800 domain-containing protein [Acetobacteraceae bacterium]